MPNIFVDIFEAKTLNNTKPNVNQKENKLEKIKHKIWIRHDLSYKPGIMCTNISLLEKGLSVPRIKLLKNRQFFGRKICGLRPTTKT